MAIVASLGFSSRCRPGARNGLGGCPSARPLLGRPAGRPLAISGGAYGDPAVQALEHPVELAQVERVELGARRPQRRALDHASAAQDLLADSQADARLLLVADQRQIDVE